MRYTYFSKQKGFFPQIKCSSHNSFGITVVIPSYNELHLGNSLSSLSKCSRPECAVEVIVVINYPEQSPDEVLQNGYQCVELVKDFDLQLSNLKFRFFAIEAFNLPRKHAGVGLARKIGMDEAAWRLLGSDNPYKIIACFDADATCSENYLIELEKLWLRNPETEACSIHYEHPVDGNEFDEIVYSGIAQYELHLRYYVEAGRYVGHPFSQHTIGSSMACSADAYTRYGGMNRFKAGEDFYFLQKIIPHGKFRELNSCYIYPSPRPSYRVPFGTGRAMTKFVERAEDTYHTYNLDSWISLKLFIEKIDELHHASLQQIESYLNKQNESLKDFLSINNFVDAITEVNANTSSLPSFRKRFFQWFDAFMLLKYMNFANETYYNRKSVQGEALKLAKLIGIPFPESDTKGLLYGFREWQKRSVLLNA